jgi:hypothetical protein
MSGTNRNKPEVFDLLSPQQINSLPMLAAGDPAKLVAEKIGITPQTISLWLNHDADFRHALLLLKKDALDAARSQLRIASIEAVAVVRKLIREGSTEQIQLKAAQLALDHLVADRQHIANALNEAAIAPASDYCRELSEKLSQ